MAAIPKCQDACRSLPLALAFVLRGIRRRLAFAMLLAAIGFPVLARAEIQFDVFLGLDDRVREGHWFPVAFEILNDGPAFTGTVTVGNENAIDSQRRQFAIELPTGTRKRVVLPAFPSAGRYSRWDARLHDPDGKVIAERTGLQPKDIAAHIPLLGALPRTFGGLPAFPEVANRGTEFLPAVARLQSDYLPAHPIALEAMTAWYLNSEKAVDLKPEQADALLSWVHSGGHLIVAVEQPTDVTAVPWLRGILPFEPETVVQRTNGGGIDAWVAAGPSVVKLPSASGQTFDNTPVPGRAPRRRGPVSPLSDPFAQLEVVEAFEKAEIPMVSGRVLDGQVVLKIGDLPLIVSAPRGRGTVTVLTFSPEREPFRSWKQRSWFWARLVGVPTELLVETDALRWGGASLDGLFGGMLDSRQVRKLPVGALLLLLVVYLAVIGPLDQWVLKRLGKQMWTWVTFPAYVVLFSGLIYFIGYRLRAGDLELNELQVVDQLPRSQGAILRGRTWLSVYSPENARYRFASEQPFATFRAELQQGGQTGGDSGRLILRQPAKGFDAEIFVPVWVSQLYASDWIETGPMLVSGEVRTDTGKLVLENRSDLRFEKIVAVFEGRVWNLGALAPQGRLEFVADPETAENLDRILSTLPGLFQTVQQRRFAFGSEHSGQIPKNLDGVVAASLIDHPLARRSGANETFGSHASFGVHPLLDRDEIVLFGWAPGQSVAAPLHRFTPTRVQRDTVVRWSVPRPRLPSA